MSRRCVLSWAAIGLAACSTEISAEDGLLLTLANAYADGDCDRVAELGPTFDSPRRSRREEAAYYLGRCFQEADRFAEAIELLTPVAEAEPPGRRAAAALYQLGRVYEASGDLEGADALFARVIRDWSDSVYLDNAYYHRLAIALRGGDCASARQLWRQLEAAAPSSDYLARGEALLRDGGCP